MAGEKKSEHAAASDLKKLEKEFKSLQTQNRKLLLENEKLTHLVQEVEHTSHHPRNAPEAQRDENDDQRNQEMYKELYENAPLPYQSLNHDGSFRDVNLAWLRVLGYTRDEVIGKNFSDFLHPESKKLFEKRFPVFKKRGYVHDVRFKIRHKNGHFLDISFEGCVGYHPDGSFRQTYCIFQDISYRLQAEQELIKTKELYQSIFDTAANLITSVDENGIIVDCNSRIKRVLGYSKKEIIGRHMFSIIHPDYHEQALASLQEILSKGYSYGEEYVFIAKDGSEKNIHINSSGLKGGNGRYYRTICILEDFTERFQQQQELIHNERQLANLFKNTTNLFYSHSTDHVLTFMSPQVKDILGYTQEEAMVRWTELATDHPVNQRGMQLTQAAIDTGKQQPTYELQLRRKDGKAIWVEVRENPVVENGKTTTIIGSLTEITERKKAQEKLEASEEKYRLLLDNQKDLVVKVNTNNVFLFVSPSYCKTFDKTLEELLGKTFMPLVHNDDLLSTELEMKKLFKPPYTCRFQQRAMTKDGWRWFEWVDTALVKNGQVTEIIGVGRDITEQKEAEIALQDSRNELQSVFEVAPTGIGRIDNRVFQDVNKRILEMTGYKRKEIIGKSARMVYPNQEEFDYVGIEKYRQIQETGTGTVETRWQRKDKKIIDVLLSSTRIDKQYPEKGTIFTVLDITDRKNAERQLLKLSVALEQSPSLITIADVDGKIEYVNSRFCQLTGYSIDDVLGKNLHFLYDGKDRDQFQSSIQSILESEREWKGEYQNKKKDGVLFWEYSSVSPIVDNQGQVINYVKVAEDVTEKKKSQLELQKLEKLESIGTLAGGIAHDFNNILTGLYGNISLAETELDEDHPSYEFLIEAEKSMVRATRLTKQLLTFSKGGTPLKEDASLDEIIHQVVKFDLSGSNVKPVIKQDEDLWVTKVDKGQIQQVFSNLTINANQAMPDGGCLYISIKNVKVDEYEILNLQPGKYVKIQVKDEGVGINKKHLSKIFDPYFTTKQTGNGLGLATTFSIIQKHQGHITVESEQGKGTVFTIYLPAVKKQKKTQVRQKPPQTNKKLTGKALVMDDEEMICSLVRRMFKQIGLKVDTVADGEACLAMYQNSLDTDEHYDIVIMDLTIPGGMGGKETIQPLLELNPNARVIVSSGYASGAIMSHYQDYGFSGVIEKPYTLSKLRRVVMRVLESEE